MNQTNSQIQFLQIVCVVLVMSTLIGMVASYILYRDVNNLEQQLAEAKQQSDSCKEERVLLTDDLRVLKSLTGYNMSDVGDEDSVEETTIVGKARSDIHRMVGSLTNPTLREAIYELNSQLENVTQERNTLKKELDRVSATQTSTRSN
ncbi:MAG: hypothetical protein KDA84_15360 [Planctomycetaceae bacterium]|nr:hypothetical protein [Planctomycetaceae bacterium]